MPRQHRFRASSDDAVEWEQPDAPGRRYQLPYTPVWEKKRGVEVFILRMNRDVDRGTLHRGLFRLLKNIVYIVDLSVDVDLFGSTYGHLIVKTQRDVREIIKRFQRTSFFGKLLEFTETDPVVPVPLAFKRAVVGLFVEKNKSQMLLVELMRIFEEKYDQTISVMDILKMPDQAQRFAIGEAQMVRLAPNAHMWLTSLVRQGCFDYLETAKCSKGCSSALEEMLPIRSSCKLQQCYRISLRDFSVKVRHLLKHHDSAMNLNTFIACYEARFGLLVEDEKGGSFLEHLLLSVPGVCVQQKPYESRKLVLVDGSEKMDDDKLSRLLLRFRWEVLEMLIMQRRSCLPFGELVQTYKMLYGKTCRVADFGCTRLADLLNVFKEDIHVMGIGNNRLITLSHSAQLYRFGKIIEELKKAIGPSQTFTTSNFALMYRSLYKHAFVPTDFGVCFLEDLMSMCDMRTETTPRRKVVTESYRILQRPRVQVEEITARLMEAVAHNSFLEQKPGVYSLVQIEKPAWSCRIDDAMEVSPLELSVSTADSSGDSAYNHSTDESALDGKSGNDEACSGGVQEAIDIKPKFVSARLAVSFG